jgi:hypothetical protein
MGADATLLLLDKHAVEQLLMPAEVTQAVREAVSESDVVITGREAHLRPGIRPRTRQPDRLALVTQTDPA